MQDVLDQENHKTQIDLFTFGVLLFYVLVGGFRWDDTSELLSRFVELSTPTINILETQDLN